MRPEYRQLESITAHVLYLRYSIPETDLVPPIIHFLRGRDPLGVEVDGVHLPRAVSLPQVGSRPFSTAPLSCATLLPSAQ
jgi:hypothetical protein